MTLSRFIFIVDDLNLMWAPCEGTHGLPLAADLVEGAVGLTRFEMWDR